MGFIYCFLSLKYGLFKVGLSKTPLKRLSNVRRTVKNELKRSAWIVPVFVIYVFDMEEVEGKIHDVLMRYNFNWVGSGKSEWHRLGLLFSGFIKAIASMIFFQLEAIFKIILIAAACMVAVYLIRVI